MKGLYYRLSPFTPDSAGAASLFADLPVLVIPVDMNGTASTFGSRVGVEDESPFMLVSVVGNREMSYVMGETQNFMDEFMELEERFGQEMTVLMNGPVSSMMGIDIAGMATEMERLTGKPTFGFDCSGNNSYEYGLSRAMLAVFERFSAAEAAPEDGAFNILGLNNVDHNDAALRSLVFNQVEAAMGGQALSVWGSISGPEEWGQANRASSNVVVAACAERLAKIMERTYGTPYKFIDELPLPLLQEVQTLPELEDKPASVLVIGEQLTGNVARRALEALGCKVTVASFFTMLKSRKQPGDFRIEGEQALEELLCSGTYDVLVSDPALVQFAPESMGFVPMAHSAVAVRGMSDASAPTPLTREWIALAREELLRWVEEKR